MKGYGTKEDMESSISTAPDDILRSACQQSTIELDEIEREENDGNYAADEYIDPPPDGGYGWICCACITSMNFATWGANCAYGVFLSFYLENDYFPGATATDFALVGGFTIGLTLALMPFTAIMLARLGYRVSISIGLVIQLAGYIGASFATKIWHLYLSQGVACGVAFGIMFGANLIVLPGWFLRKRALANAITHFGLGVGGVVFSLSVNAIIDRTGNQKWALRMLGIVSFFICFVAMFIVKIRVPKKFKNTPPPQPGTLEILKKIFDYKIWKIFPLQLVTIWGSLCGLGYVILLYSLSNYAVVIGLSQKQATTITTVLNASQAIGRPFMGYGAEKIGRTNFTMLATFICGLMVFVFWFQANSYGTLIGYSVVAGFLIGIGSVNIVPLVADVVGINAYSTAMSFTLVFQGVFSFAAELIALHLRDFSLKNPYRHCEIFVGCIYFAAVLFLFPYREWKIKRLLAQRVVNGDDRSEYYKEVLKEGPLPYVRRTIFAVYT